MRYNVSSLLKANVGETRSYPIDAECLSEADETINCHLGQVRLTRTRRGILADVKADVSTRCTCAWCLEPFECPLHLEFSEEFVPSIDINTGVPLPEPEEPAFRIDEHHILDLGEALRQYTVMELPIRPLCREECAGICPSCGKDLNTGQCSCEIVVDDARLAGLRNLIPPAEEADREADEK